VTDKQSFSASNLSVNRGDRPVFQNLSFELAPGKLLKLVGPNGSGKSTLLKTLAGLIEAAKGDILKGELSVQGDREWTAENICYLGHKNALKREFTVLENIEFWAGIWGNPDKVNSSIHQMGIDYLTGTPVRYLSSGQTRRTALARSLCHGANIWLFDEPTVGLDEQGLSLLADAMKNHLKAGGMIICATHVELGLDEGSVKSLDLANFTVSVHDLGDQW
jgi:heme exporter protein A